MSKSEVLSLIYKSTIEVAPAVSTALATTIVSFLPVFFMEHAEGKLFKPLAFTKTFALGAAFVIGMVILPALSYYMFSFRLHREKIAKAWNISLMVAGIILAIVFKMWLPLVLVLLGSLYFLQPKINFIGKYSKELILAIILLVTIGILSDSWSPLGLQSGIVSNYIFVIVLLSLILLALWSVVKY